ncbi:unnamed protein product [Owenia fusiformis]|uniref:NFX1-type zinc finger-containing protein 1 n=1 Tax=Owenia fusiformis TaxID=6347 RepID=A0A8S4QAN1_OWEFU|nr:unnamed protein product [Owenia fusiformis]
MGSSNATFIDMMIVNDPDEPIQTDTLDDIDDESEGEANGRILDEEEWDTDQNSYQQNEMGANATAEILDVDFNCIDKTENSKYAYEWQTVQSKRSKKQQYRKLDSTDMMSEDEAQKCIDIWEMSTIERWRLYRYWVNKYRTNLKEKIQACEMEYERIAQIMSDLKREEDCIVMKDAVIIGMTTTGAAKYRAILQQVRPKIVIVEEAAEVLESHIVTTLTEECEHLILIGDHKQLRPNPTVYDLAIHFNLEISFFERMINNAIPYECLERQHRMRPEVSELIADIYPELKDHPSVRVYGDVKGVAKNMFFVSHSVQEKSDVDLRSKSNPFEAEYIVALCKYLIQQGYKREEITILTLYTGQMFTIKNLMPKAFFNGVRVCAVDSFQGEENMIVLLSLVRSNNKGSIGFVGIENRICVALSRAKKGFYAIGNMKLFAEKNRLWKKINKRLKLNGNVADHLELYCQNHPSDNHIKAKTAKDFNKAPSGGCQKKCALQLECGHACTQRCHVVDVNHKDYQCKVLKSKVIPSCGHSQNMPCYLDPNEFLCQMPCGKYCSNGHMCSRKCHMDCGDCQILIEKVIPSCGHRQDVPCCRSPDEVKCLNPCERTCEYGHICKKLCHQECGKCRTRIGKKLKPCGHTRLMACYEDPDLFKGRCHEFVNKVIPKCLHTLQVKCHMDPSFVICNEMVRKEIPSCGHIQEMRCHVDPATLNGCCIMVDKIIPSCGHKQKVECFTNPADVKCLMPCSKKCENDHPCPEQCHIALNATKIQIPPVLSVNSHVYIRWAVVISANEHVDDANRESFMYHVRKNSAVATHAKTPVRVDTA